MSKIDLLFIVQQITQNSIKTIQKRFIKYHDINNLKIYIHCGIFKHTEISYVNIVISDQGNGISNKKIKQFIDDKKSIKSIKAIIQNKDILPILFHTINKTDKVKFKLEYNMQTESIKFSEYNVNTKSEFDINHGTRMSISIKNCDIKLYEQQLTNYFNFVYKILNKFTNIYIEINNKILYNHFVLSKPNNILIKQIQFFKFDFINFLPPKNSLLFESQILGEKIQNQNDLCTKILVKKSQETQSYFNVFFLIISIKKICNINDNNI